jgi:diguanylate cyclase (GGDEF)-like protein
VQNGLLIDAVGTRWVPVVNTVLRRRMLLIYLATGLVLYTLAIVTSLGRPDAWGERVAVAVSAAGLLAAIPRPLCGRRYTMALVCACIAPLAPVLGHQEPAAQVWALIPLMFIAVFVRSWHRAKTARLVAALLAAGVMVGLWIAPAPVPWLWFLLFPLCILGAAELLGLLHAALVEAALRDPLTAVWNRAGLNRELDDLLPRARRRGESLAVIVLDIDDFKSVNDRDGHAAGDAVLMQLTRRWTRQLPASALVGRLGGDEFVAIVAGYDESQARALADTLSGDGPVHVSTGIAVGPAYEPGSFAKMLTAADRDLYRLKNFRKSRNTGDVPPPVGFP